MHFFFEENGKQMIKEIKRKTSKLTIHIIKNQMPTIAMVYHTTQAVQIIRDLNVPLIYHR
jgi:hypothetical protein